jgi:hypothetical protein
MKILLGDSAAFNGFDVAESEAEPVRDSGVMESKIDFDNMGPEDALIAVNNLEQKAISLQRQLAQVGSIPSNRDEATELGRVRDELAAITRKIQEITINCIDDGR